MRTWKILTILAISSVWSCGNNPLKGHVELKKMSVPVTVATARQGYVDRVLKIGGSVKGLEERDIVPDVPGRVARVLVKEGDLVKKGQVLAELDTKQTRIQFQQAQAALDAAQAQLTNARQELTRTRQLFKRGAVTRQQLDAVEAGAKAAKANVDRARAMVDLARHAIEVSTMKAPFDGMVTGRFRDPGDMINPLMQSLSPLAPNAVVRVARLDQVLVDGFVADRDWAWIHDGMPARVTVDAWPGDVFEGRVTKVMPAADTMSRTFMVEVTVENKKVRLRPGMYARVFLTQERQKGVTVPLDALVKRDGGYLVFSVAEGKAHLHKVKVGLRSKDRAVVLEGLKPGLSVVVQGNIALKEGTPVRVIEDLDAKKAKEGGR
jgi:membrane fusion protein (multidrug efflux system)/multidrug efflux system membrane fusion protein/cobalt-zinc-cadmium efflux system membrane fusion protein